MVACGLLLGAATSAKDAPKLKVISVADAFAQAADYSGEVGIEGHVVSVDAKARSFEIHTPNPPDACQEECCAPKRLPVEVPAASFKGTLPKKGDKVVIVGDFKPLTVGFDFTPKEVRAKGKAIISRK